MDLKKKKGVKLRPEHFLYHTGRIVTCLSMAWYQEYPIWITRGCEDCEGSNPNSRHFKNKAFDFRTRHLPTVVDRQAILDRALALLGPDYRGYYGTLEDGTEWLHLQFNRD